ncbi:MAG: hypothetical protein D6681_19885 [Calditrichaeota bacterium]|nr:MAG: hypothetical protein D6681_19885 [Calditrichota bacterium]
MGDALKRAQQLHREIRKVLMEEWDPIGVSDIPEAADEYDAYVPTIYRLLIRRASVQDIFDYLWWAETEHMGLCGNRQATKSVAVRLSELPKRLTSHKRGTG